MIVRNRYSGEDYQELDETGTGEARKILERGRLAARDMEKLRGYEISDLLYSISDSIRKNSGLLAEGISVETAKPIRQSRAEVERSIHAFVAAAEEIISIEGTSVNGGSRNSLREHMAFSSHVPAGPILSIHPFTEPLYSPSSRIAASLATGNAIVLKPSSQAPLSTVNLMQILQGIGFPEYSVQAFIGSRSSKALKLLMKDGSFGMATFSGRIESIPAFMKLSVPRRNLLEAGSSSPAIVWEDADLDSAAEAVVNSAFNFQGQAPVRTQSVIVRQESYEYFKNRLIELTGQLKPGVPLEEETDYGPLIDDPAGTSAEALVEEARKNAGYVIAGGNSDGRFFKPTIIDCMETSSNLIRKQVLAPILTVHQVQSFNEAVEVANNTGKSGQAGIFTSDINLAMTALDRLHADTVLINDAPGLPTETISSSNPGASITSSRSMRHLMRNMIREKIAVLRR